jgi:hypothetical protein
MQLKILNALRYGAESGILIPTKRKDSPMDEQTEKAMRKMFAKLDAIKPFTVGQMKQALEGLSDDTQILIGGPENSSFDWANLDLEYERPDTNEDVSALTFYIKDDYDPRQF